MNRISAKVPNKIKTGKHALQPNGGCVQQDQDWRPRLPNIGMHTKRGSVWPSVIGSKSQPKTSKSLVKTPVFADAETKAHNKIKIDTQDVYSTNISAPASNKIKTYLSLSPSATRLRLNIVKA